MKIKTVRSLIILSLVAVLVIAGTTTAWFTDEEKLPSAAGMVVGTLEFEITDARVIPDDGDEGQDGGDSQSIEWKAGECKELAWTFRNTGTKTAFFRARVDCELTRIVPGEGETAWGDEFRFVDKEQGQWARYFIHNKGSTTQRMLLAGQHYDAGTVTVWEEAGKLHVRYDTNDGWYLTGTHFGVAENKDGLLKKDKTLPSPGQLAYKNKHVLAQSFTRVVDLPDYNPVYLAAHADVVRGGTEVVDDAQITWSLPEGSPWEEGEPPDGWFYYCQPVRSGEEITLVLIGCLDEAAVGGSGEVKLIAESVQATHGASYAEWPNRPD